MSTFDAGSVEARLILDKSDFNKSLDQAKADADKFSGRDIKVKVAADNATANRGLADTQGRADKLGKTSPSVKLSVTNSAANKSLDDTLARLLLLHDRDIRVSVSGGPEAAAEIGALNAALKTTAGSGGEASGALSGLLSPMAGLIAAGVALAPIAVTLGTGLAGFAAAAYAAAKPIEAAATATGGLKANMDTLNPVQQQVATGILDLEGKFGAFSKSLQPEVFSAFNSGLTIAGRLLTDVAPVAKATGSALDDILKKVAGGLQDKEWTQFFTFMSTTAGPDVQLVGNAFGSLLSLLPPVLEDLQPIAQQMLILTTNFTEAAHSVADFGKSNNQVSASVGTNTGLLGFLTRAVSNVTSFMKPGGVVAGAYKTAIDGIPGSTGKAADATQRLGAAQRAAQPSAVNLGADLQVLSSDTASAATQTTALTNAWNILVGNFASKETAILNAQQAVQAFGQSVKQNGAGSLAAKSAFESAVTSIGQMVAAMQKAHAPASQIYADLQSQIRALQASGPLNAEETRQLNGMKQAADAVAQSTVGWTGATKGAASALQANMLPQLSRMKADTPAVRADIDHLTTSIVNTGTQSSASHGARARLIQDLENAGVHADKARAFVRSLQTSINALHGKTVTIHMNGQGLYTITGSAIAKSQGPGGSGNAAGGLATGGRITGPGGPTADKAGLYALSNDEWVIRASSSNRYGHAAMDAVNRGTAVIGYASGGSPGAGAVSGNLSGSYVAGMYGAFQEKMTAAMVAAMRAAMKAAEAAAAKAAAASAGNVNYKPGAGVEQWRGVVVRALALAGASTSLANNVLYQMQTESGGNPRAVNLWDSNAKAGHPSVGLMQVIQGTYAAYGAPKMGYPAPVAYGVSEQPLANTYAGIRYAQSAYGPSLRNSRGGIGSGHGYARGTDGASAGWALTGEQGPELVRFHGGETVLPADVTSAVLGRGGGSYPGYAGGTLSVSALGAIIKSAPKEGLQKDVASLHAVLKNIATTLGIKGLTRADSAHLKAERVKDQRLLATATAHLKALADKRKQVTGVTEPKLKSQIGALSHVGKLSAAETRLLKTLKASLAWQQWFAGQIDTAIYGKQAAKPKPAASGTGASGDGSGDAGGADAGAGDTGPSTPRVTDAQIAAAAQIGPGTAGGVAAGVPASSGARLSWGGAFSGVPAGGLAGYSQASAAAGAPQGSAQDGGWGMGNIERLLAEILHATRSVPAGISGGVGAALNGSAHSAYFRARYPQGGW